jgi:hypothetical protein
MDTEKVEHTSGQDNSPAEEKKPIFDQMTDLAAQSAGTLTEAAVKKAAKRAKKAVAERLPMSIRKKAKPATKAPMTKGTTKKAAKKKKSAKAARSSAGRKAVGKKAAVKKTKKKKGKR